MEAPALALSPKSERKTEMTTDLDTSGDLTAAEKAQAIDRAISMMRAAADFLNCVSGDARVDLCIVELEGMGLGWYHPKGDDREFLVDLLDDVRLELLGTPIPEHWRGHATTQEE